MTLEEVLLVSVAAFGFSCVKNLTVAKNRPATPLLLLGPGGGEGMAKSDGEP
jgi:hypothetical protein